MGTYELMEGNRIKFSGVASTMMACPDMAIENQLGKAIEMADNYAISGKFLMLHKAKMAPLVKFEAK
jgi:heat shock protein HslJ